MRSENFLAKTRAISAAGTKRGGRVKDQGIERASVTMGGMSGGQMVLGHLRHQRLPTRPSQIPASTLPDEKRPDPGPDIGVLPQRRYGGIDVRPARRQRREAG